MKRAIVISAVIAALAIPSAVVVAKGMSFPHGDSVGYFDKYDANGDGKLILDELPDHKAQKFERMDLDGDGAITRDEAEQARNKGRHHKMAKMMKHLDLDGNGEISQSEFTARALTMFEKADKNGDGVVTEDEVKKLGRGFKGHKRGHK